MTMNLTIWMILNVVDFVISMVAVQYGAGEIGFLSQMPGSWAGIIITKMTLAAMVGAVLFRKERADLLALLSLGLGAICVYNIWVLVQQARI